MKTILNCKEKKCYFTYENEDFSIDLTEGDLDDNWNSITLKNGDIKDFNFSWQESCEPSITLYRVDEDNTTDFYDETTLYFDEIVGTYEEYFSKEVEDVITKSFTIRFIGNITVEADSLEQAQEVVQTMEVDFNEVFVEDLI